jgi:hypothetical protein
MQFKIKVGNKFLENHGRGHGSLIVESMSTPGGDIYINDAI